MSGLEAAPVIGFVLTRDRRAGRQFQSDVLGLTLAREDDFAAMFETGGMELRVTSVEVHTPHPQVVIGWTVVDTSETVLDLSERGVTFSVYPGLGQDEVGIWTSPDGKMRVAWFKDPYGTVLSLTQG